MVCLQRRAEPLDVKACLSILDCAVMLLILSVADLDWWPDVWSRQICTTQECSCHAHRHAQLHLLHSDRTSSLLLDYEL